MQARVLHPMRRRPRPSSKNQRGIVTIEVLMALIPLLTIFLGVTQLALLWMGKLVVQHAAARAARAAIVILDDDPKHYGGAARGNLTDGQSSGTNPALRQFEDVGAGYLKALSLPPTVGGARMEDIRKAAYFPLAVLGPPPLSSLSSQGGTLASEFGAAGDAGLADQITASSTARLAYGALVYAPRSAAVTLHVGEGEALTEIPPRAVVTLKLAFLMPCGVPLVGPLMCHSGRALLQAQLLPEFSSEDERETMQHLQHVASPMQRDVGLMLGGSYALITAEATLPNQGANYHKD